MHTHKYTHVHVKAGNATAAIEQIGEFEASGFLFKDMIEISAYDDPVEAQCRFDLMLERVWRLTRAQLAALRGTVLTTGSCHHWGRQQVVVNADVLHLLQKLKRGCAVSSDILLGYVVGFISLLMDHLVKQGWKERGVNRLQPHTLVALINTDPTAQ
eukprot:scaffold19106_cov18-Tisochrysis_lutea.AAC.1